MTIDITSLTAAEEI